MRIEATEHGGLIADQSGTSIHRIGVAALGLQVRFGTGDKEAAGLVQVMQPLKVHVAPIHHVVGACFRRELIEDVDVVHLAVGDVDKARNIAAQIWQRMHLDGRFGGSERCPRKHRQAQIDRRGVERIDGLGQIHTEESLGIQAPCDTDQALRKVGVDTPVARRIGIGQGVARNVVADPQVIEPAPLRTQAGLNVAQGLPIGQLREYELTLMHRAIPRRRQPQSLRSGADRCSNRD